MWLKRFFCFLFFVSIQKLGVYLVLKSGLFPWTCFMRAFRSRGVVGSKALYFLVALLKGAWPRKASHAFVAYIPPSLKLQGMICTLKSVIIPDLTRHHES